MSIGEMGKGAIGVAAGLGVAAFGWLRHRKDVQEQSREHSGTVETSDAASIWKAAADFREEQREALASRSKEISELRRDLTAAVEEIAQLKMELASTRIERYTLQEQVEHGRREVDALRVELGITKTEAAVLRRKVDDQAEAIRLVRKEMHLSRPRRLSDEA